MFPENDSLNADLDVEMANACAMKIFEDRDQGDNIVMPIPEADAESENELDCVGMLEERLRDANIVEEEGDDFLQNRGRDRNNIVPTPPEQFSNCDVSGQYLFPYAQPLPLKRNLPLQPGNAAYGVYASLCIAAELGLSSLIDPPKRLLEGKRNAKGPKNAAYRTSFFAATFLTCAFVVTAQSPPGARCRIPHRSRWFRLPQRPSRTR